MKFWDNDRDNEYWDEREPVSEAELADQEDQIEEPVESAPSYEARNSEPEDLDFDDEELDSQVLKDASLRLEQGNLYKMLLKHDLFDGVDADPRAVSNVQRELRAYIRERLEILVGLRQDPKIALKRVTVELPFTDLEIEVLKTMLAKATQNMPEQKAVSKPALAPVRQSQQALRPLGQQPQKSSLNRVAAQPLQKPRQLVEPKSPAQRKPAPTPPPRKAAVAPTQPEPKLDKSPYEMTPDELANYNKTIAMRQVGKKAKAIGRKTPMPDSQQVAQYYANRVQTSNNTGYLNTIMSKLGVKLGTIEDAGNGFDY